MQLRYRPEEDRSFSRCLNNEFVSIRQSLRNAHLQLQLEVSDDLEKMEKITDKIAALRPDANYFSLEFFPPKTPMVGPRIA